MASTKPPQTDDEWVHSVANALDRVNNGGVSWTVLLAALGFAGSVVYGGWVLNQSQLAGIHVEIEQLRKDADVKTSNLAAELIRREVEIKTTTGNMDRAINDRINSIETELQHRRSEFVDTKEYMEFKDRIVDEVKVIREQLKTLETSRPSNGELQAVAFAAGNRIDKLESRIKDISDFISAHSARDPVEKQAMDTVNERINRIYELYQDLNQAIRGSGKNVAPVK